MRNEKKQTLQIALSYLREGREEGKREDDESEELHCERAGGLGVRVVKGGGREAVGR